MSRFLLAILTLSLAGCTVVTPGEMGQSSVSHRFGYIRIVTQDMGTGASISKTATLGVAFENGVTIGWRENEKILMRPDECKLIVIVKSEQDMLHAQQILSAMKGDNICVTQI